MALLDELGDRGRLRAAWQDVEANRGMPGIDRVTIASYGAELERNLDELAGEVREGRYRPQPVLRIRPPFLAESDRALVVPTVRDRVLQRTVVDLLRPLIEPTLTDACVAFRKGSSATRAADQVGRWVEAGYAWALRADIEKFFDNIRPDLLLDKLRAFVEEADVALLSRIVRAKVFDHDALIEPVSGIAQGSPLSPLLANLYLADMDRKVAAGHPRYLRYCDDLIVMERLEVEVVEARALVQRELAAAGLSLNERKTKVARVEDGFDFLGYRFGPTGKGPAVKTLGALRFRLDEIARAEAAPLDDLDALFRGWTAYYGLRKEAWIESAVGILALLRQHRELTREELVEKVSPARWALGGEAPWLGSALAAAWRANGLEEFAWMELARECGKGRTPIPDAWSRMLGVPAAELGALAGRLAGRGTEDALSLLAEAATSAGRYEVAARLSALQSIVQAPPIPATTRSWRGGFRGATAFMRSSTSTEDTGASSPTTGSSNATTGERTCAANARWRCRSCAPTGPRSSACST